MDNATEFEDEDPHDEDEPCDYCGGEGVLHEDRARGHEHYTVEVPCPECSNGAPFDDSRTDYDTREERAMDVDTSGLKDPR